MEKRETGTEVGEEKGREGKGRKVREGKEGKRRKGKERNGAVWRIIIYLKTLYSYRTIFSIINRNQQSQSNW